MTSGAANLSARLAASYRWAAALACATLLIACNGSGTLTGGGGSGNGTAPTISTQPRSQTVNAGATAMFSVVAAGGGTLAYQWDRHRGRGYPRSPATPPDMRVRIRRFGGLSRSEGANVRSPSESK